MARGGKRANTGGVRPGAGRKTHAQELRTIEVLQKCQEICLEFLNDPSVPAKKKIDVASRLYYKAIPQDINMSGEMTHNLFMQSLIEKSRMTT